MSKIVITTINGGPRWEVEAEDSVEYTCEEQAIINIFGEDAKMFIQSNSNSIPILAIIAREDKSCKCLKKLSGLLKIEVIE